ncbi:hypothetical protein [Alloalcanivorax xenomutans]|uniref:Uncharacterized protein n=1 Tax=Alloalcanivorax xenomutans TaxID=1094342 RepID=A0A9Q3ZFZ0_9GAMM|nr:hypothetical protein [Alloalcanivorax xenomutans]MCE7510271.1 hypothetical protein [Alloalcanivorax xenomutans]
MNEQQRAILEKLNAAYPGKIRLDAELPSDNEAAYQAFAANVVYLEENGLLEADKVEEHGAVHILYAKLTSAGRDFLNPTGGLGAQLKVQTIKLHPDTVSDLRELLGHMIDQSDRSEHDKSALKRGVEKAGEEALKTFVQRLVGYAIESAPDLQRLASTLF